MNETTLTVYTSRATELGIAEFILEQALHIISKNKNMVNAMDNCAEMDDYIYRAILREAFTRRQQLAELNLQNEDPVLQAEAMNDMVVLSREELGSHPFYRAVLPLIVKVIDNNSILKLHAEEASEIILKLADLKRRYRATSITEVIVKKCSAEIENYAA
ncbi:MAG: hypothetical protein ACXWB9_07350 [Flavisolibacter sp.]